MNGEGCIRNGIQHKNRAKSNMGIMKTSSFELLKQRVNWTTVEKPGEGHMLRDRETRGKSRV